MKNNLPALTDGSLSDYLNEIKKFPMLTSEEEFMLAKAWVDHDDRKSAHRLVTSHLRLAAKIALGYRGYGLPINEVVSEANVGLMQAVKRFDPDKGFRLATYAMWWIKASIQEYILRSWSLVKMGTTSAQKKLFFNLRKAKNRIGVMEDGELHPDNVKSIAENLNVSQDEVISMNRRMGGGDASLNVLVNTNNEGTLEWQDWIEDEDSDHAAKFADKQELDSRRVLLKSALTSLNQRECEILTKRKLIDDPLTLEDLSNLWNGIEVSSLEPSLRSQPMQIETRTTRNWQLLANDPQDNNSFYDTENIYYGVTDTTLNFKYEYYENWADPYENTVAILMINIDNDIQTGATIDDFEIIEGIDMMIYSTGFSQYYGAYYDIDGVYVFSEYYNDFIQIDDVTWENREDNTNEFSFGVWL